MKGVGNKRRNASKFVFLRYSTGVSGIIVELFSRRPYIKISFCRFTISISRFRIPGISRKYPGNFSEISRKFHLPSHPPPPTPLTHPIHPPTPLIPYRTSNPFSSKTHFDCICTFITHTLHIYMHPYMSDHICTHIYESTVLAYQ